ncbi:hypothetical protein ID525_003867 [Escherichia coli]|nr:hypothetical protein [Escherichia coli]EGH1416269.1 hypothetical protein [Escherichia coli]
MLIAKYLCLLKPFWLRKNNKTSVLLIIIILAMILGVVKIQVWLNDWNNDFFNALSQKETDKLWQLVLWFPALLGIFVLISVNKTWLIKLLTIRWREWLTDYYLNRWFADKNYYFTQIYGEHKNTDNPDQRIAEDILLLISKTLSLSFGFIQSLSMLITFTVILWQSAGTLSFTVGGTEWNIQGYMVYTVVLIVIGGTLFTHKVGKRIRPLNVEKQRSEATFRTNLVQHNKQAELIALSNAESLQRQELRDNFHTIKENWHRLMNRQRWLDYWQNIYSRSLSVLPYFTWFASDRFTHDLTLKYTGSSRDYNTSTFPQSDREMGNKSYGLAWDMDTQLAWAKLRTTVGWDHISDYTRHDHDIWYTELSCTYGDITGRCTRGGLGHISQAVDNYTFKTRLDWQKFAVGNVSHQPYFGAEYIYSDAWTERHNQSESYVINAAGKKTNHTIYHKGKGSLGIDNYTLYMADRISWRNVSLMPGVRYDYDNYLSNHNISPRFMTEWDIFANQTSMITAGYNRYYGGNILDMGLRDIRNSWTESVSGNKTLTRYQDLKTPYNDELAMGLQQKIGKNVIARANYVYREAHDQISKSSRTDSATKTTITEYNNDGKTKTHSFSLSFELAEPLHIRQVDINPQIVFSYIKSKGNLSLNNGYEESNTGDNQVVYNGNLVSYDSVPVADFNNPLKISLNMDFTHQPSGLVWANTLAWQEARKARIILGKTNAQYISEYSDYKQYVDEKLDSSLTWDTRLSWTPQFLKQQNLTISADILNVLDSKTAVDTTNTGVATYASGRTFWLDVSMKF